LSYGKSLSITGHGQYGTYVNITGNNLIQNVGLNIRTILLAGVKVDNISYASSTIIQIRAPKASANVSGVVRIELETGAYCKSSNNWVFTPPIMISNVFPTIGAVGSKVYTVFPVLLLKAYSCGYIGWCTFTNSKTTV